MKLLNEIIKHIKTLTERIDLLEKKSNSQEINLHTHTVQPQPPDHFNGFSSFNTTLGNGT